MASAWAARSSRQGAAKQRDEDFHGVRESISVLAHTLSKTDGRVSEMQEQMSSFTERLEMVINTLVQEIPPDSMNAIDEKITTVLKGVCYVSELCETFCETMKHCAQADDKTYKQYEQFVEPEVEKTPEKATAKVETTVGENVKKCVFFEMGDEKVDGQFEDMERLYAFEEGHGTGEFDRESFNRVGLGQGLDEKDSNCNGFDGKHFNAKGFEKEGFDQAEHGGDGGEEGDVDEGQLLELVGPCRVYKRPVTNQSLRGQDVRNIGDQHALRDRPVMMEGFVKILQVGEMRLKVSGKARADGDDSLHKVSGWIEKHVKKLAV
jgi:hypothetical protein